MRFLCLYKRGKAETNTPPSQAEMTAMGRLIEDMSKAGVLLATEGCLSSEHGMRVTVDAGMFHVSDGPFSEQELVSGLCMMQVKSKAEAIEWCKRFLSVVKVGQSEVYQLHDYNPAA
ncbi:MAG TPA: YciI family protein [Polyangiaceae bacterium]|jgi:hypothetical protein